MCVCELAYNKGHSSRNPRCQRTSAVVSWLAPMIDGPLSWRETQFVTKTRWLAPEPPIRQATYNHLQQPATDAVAHGGATPLLDRRPIGAFARFATSNQQIFRRIATKKRSPLQIQALGSFLIGARPIRPKLDREQQTRDPDLGNEHRNTS